MTNSRHGAYWIKSHGMTNTRIYRVWRDMKQRCNNPKCANYINYGARGIKVCDEWNDDFISFYHWASTHGYNLELSIDRIDNDSNYSPDNCRWTTRIIQNINKRPTSPNTSGFVGIKKHTSGAGWYGSVKIKNVDHYTGYSKDIMEAVRMRNDFIIKNHLPNTLNEVIA